MDFPSSLRPSLFMAGPLGMTDGPDLSFMCSWRDALTLPGPQPQNCKDRTLPMSKNLLWEPMTPGPLPLLPPDPDPWEPGMTPRDLLFRGGHRYQFQPQVGLDVTEQLSHFLWDHGDIAFAPLGKLMLENFRLEGSKGYSKKMTIVSVKRLLQDLGGHQPWGCPWAFLSHRLRRFSILGGPVLSRSVSALLGRLLHEELAMRWEQLLLDEAFTGGALAWLPGRTARTGQLVYPSGGALDKLYFQEVSVNSSGNPRVLEDPGHIQLRGPVRQVVTNTVQGETLLAVRSDYHCAVWKTDKQGPPAPLQVLQVEKGATGVSLSPHLPGEMAICSRSGAVCLWTPQDGLQPVYKDLETLAFRDPSLWRWADFTAHPRVLTVGDRTGVKMVDIQGPPGCGLLLFRAGAEAACQKGERVLLAQYLGQPGSACTPLHLICTQFSIYLMDERLPLVPMLKWDHGLPSAPLLARLLPPASPGCPRPLLLGGQGGQLQLLHIAGEGTSMPQLAGPPQSLPSIIDSLPAFPPLEPKRQQQLQERLEAPVIGLAAAPPCASSPVLLLFQLSAAGDIFYQRLRLQPASSLGEGELLDHSAPECPASKAVAPSVDQSSWAPQDSVRCRRWVEALMELSPTCPVWSAPTFSHRRFLGHMEHQKSQTMSQKFRAAMAKGQLLRPEDLGTLPRAEPPPAPQCSQQDELTERLKEAWEGGLAAWWKGRQGQTSRSQTQTKRPKRRTQLASTFSSLTSYADFPDTSSPPCSQDLSTSGACPQPPGSQASQLTQEPWAQGVQRERRQTLRDYMARLPLKDTPALVATPSSQTSSLQAMPFRQQAPVLSGSHPPRKKPRMGF
ncbi:TATA box-binding protein-associated factor RNA polymerase I subunit C isoform X1 [Sigmodon hispidus]